MPCKRLAMKRRYALLSCGMLVAAVLLMLAHTSTYAQRPGFSKNQEADALMREGEAHFAAQEWDKALSAYEKAFKLDP